MIVVADSGSLIALAQIGMVHLLQVLYGQIYIPPAVRDEVIVSGRGLPGSEELAQASWVKTVEPKDMTAVELLRERLDLGESQAIVLAIELGASLLLMDEARGRRLAEARGLNKIGTVGTLVVAQRRGMITAVTPLLDELGSRGFHMGAEVYRTAQSLAGEDL
jgi:uncharacterized protein